MKQRHPGDTYSRYEELCRNEIQGIDYRILLIPGESGIAVMAPHGGNIEPGVSEIARAIAADTHTFYAFEGLKPTGNRRLHITSTCFDEPLCLDTLQRSQVVAVIHGCQGKDERVYVGGRDEDFKHILEEHLLQAGFPPGKRSDLQGRSDRNLCNRCLRKMGVQLEITTGLRRRMFVDLTGGGRLRATHLFSTFVSTVRQAIEYFARTHLRETTHTSHPGKYMEC